MILCAICGGKVKKEGIFFRCLEEDVTWDAQTRGLAIYDSNN